MSEKTETIIVSACLLGIPSRYDGGHSKNDEFIKGLAGKVVIAICPEELGGLPTPRPAAEIKAGDAAKNRCVPERSENNGCVTTIGSADGASVLDGMAKVMNIDGKEVTENFIKGAEETLQIARKNQATRAYLKEKSPSCGVTTIKSNNKDCKGSGVTAELLRRDKIKTIGVS